MRITLVVSHILSLHIKDYLLNVHAKLNKNKIKYLHVTYDLLREKHDLLYMRKGNIYHM